MVRNRWLKPQMEWGLLMSEGEEGAREPSNKQGGMFLLSCSFPERNCQPTSL